MFCRLNEGIAYCPSPPTWQVLLLDVPFILLVYKKNDILFLILVPTTPSPLLSCLPSHLASSSVRGAIHTSYMKRNSIFAKENYKSAKCNIAFELKRLLVNQRRIHLLTEAENGRNSRPEWLIPRCISTSYHTMVSPKNLSQITALNHE